MPSGGWSARRAGRQQRRLAACMRLVDVDWATSCPVRSRRAPAASAPSWIHVLCELRTTTMLASSTATSRALRMTSAVIVSSTTSDGGDGTGLGGHGGQVPVREAVQVDGVVPHDLALAVLAD